MDPTDYLKAYIEASKSAEGWMSEPIDASVQERDAIPNAHGFSAYLKGKGQLRITGPKIQDVAQGRSGECFHIYEVHVGGQRVGEYKELRWGMSILIQKYDGNVPGYARADGGDEVLLQFGPLWRADKCQIPFP